jgi:hypothetical protein
MGTIFQNGMSPASPCTVATEVYIPPMNSLVRMPGTGDPSKPYDYQCWRNKSTIPAPCTRLQLLDTSLVWN